MGRCLALEGTNGPWGGYGGEGVCPALGRGSIWGNAWTKEGGYGEKGVLGERLWAQHAALGTPLGVMPNPWGISRGLWKLGWLWKKDAENALLAAAHPRGISCGEGGA